MNQQILFDNDSQVHERSFEQLYGKLKRKDQDCYLYFLLFDRGGSASSSDLKLLWNEKLKNCEKTCQRFLECSLLSEAEVSLNNERTFKIHPADFDCTLTCANQRFLSDSDSQSGSEIQLIRLKLLSNLGERILDENAVNLQDVDVTEKVLVFLNHALQKGNEALVDRLLEKVQDKFFGTTLPHHFLGNDQVARCINLSDCSKTNKQTSLNSVRMAVRCFSQSNRRRKTYRKSQRVENVDAPSNFQQKTLVSSLTEAKAYQLLYVMAAQVKERFCREMKEPNKKGLMPIHEAAAFGLVDCIRLFANTSSVDIVTLCDSSGRTPIHWAVEENRWEVLKFFLEKNPRTTTSESVAKLVIQTKQVELFRLLIEHDASIVTKRDGRGWSVGHLAAANGLIQFIEILIETGCSLESNLTNDGETVAHLASENGHNDVTRVLLDFHPAFAVSTDKRGWTIWHWLALRGDTELMKSLVESRTIGTNQYSALEDVSERFATFRTLQGNTPIHLAASEGHKEVVQLLIRTNEVNAAVTNKTGETAAHTAARKGHVSVIQSILDVMPGIAVVADENGYTIAHTAAQEGHVNIIRALSAFDEKVFNFRANDGKTAVHLAAENGHLEAVDILTELSPASAVMQDKAHKIPAHLALKNQHIDVVRKLIEKHPAVASAPTGRSLSFLQLAAENGYCDLVKHTIHQYPQTSILVDRHGSNIAHWAAATGNGKILQYMIDLQPQVLRNVKNDFGEKPIHLAAKHGHFNIVKVLISFDPTAAVKTDNHGWTPAHWAAMKYHERILYFLVSFNADTLVIRDKKNGETLGHFIARKGTAHLMKFMLEKNYEVATLRNYDGKTPAHLAAEEGSEGVLKVLIDFKPAIASMDDNDGKTPLDLLFLSSHVQFATLQFMLEKVPNILYNCTNSEGETFCHLAAKAGRDDLVKSLVEGHPEFVVAEDNYGRTPAYWAALNGHTNTLKILLEKAPEVAAIPSEHGITPMHLMAFDYCLDLIKLVLDKTPSAAIATDKRGRTPAHFAVRNNATQAVRLFIAVNPAVADMRDVDGETPGQVVVDYFQNAILGVAEAISR